MNWRCLLSHHWQGCRCDRCGESRNEGHDWKDCRCRRCGSLRYSNHKWAGCVCESCGRKRHQWQDGVCMACGTRCSHEPDSTPGSVWASAPTAHGSELRVCARCGARL